MEALFQGLLSLNLQSFIMMAVGGILILLAVKKDYEPMLLLPIGFGALIVLYFALIIMNKLLQNKNDREAK